MRYLPLTEADRGEMLAAIGVSTIDDLYRDVPEAARLNGLVDLPRHQGENGRRAAHGGLGAKDLTPAARRAFGLRAYRHHVPASVDHIVQRGEFLTAYTPYQPEIAQEPYNICSSFKPRSPC